MRALTQLPPGIPRATYDVLPPDEKDVFRMAFASALAEDLDWADANARAREGVAALRILRARPLRGIVAKGMLLVVPDLEKYDPDQPRDDRGRWSRGGGVDRYGDPSSREDAESEDDLDWPDEEVALPSSIVYHGTFGKVLDKISREGLTPGARDRRNFGGDPLLYRGERGKSVFVSSDLATAAGWASTVALANDLSDPIPVVLKMQVPAGELGSFQRDEVAGGGDNFYRPGVIPPEWIKGYAVRPPRGGRVHFKSFPRVGKGDGKIFYAAIVVVEALEKDFDPSQPRDEVGRWTRTGTRGASRWLRRIEDREVVDKPSLDDFKADVKAWADADEEYYEDVNESWEDGYPSEAALRWDAGLAAHAPAFEGGSLYRGIVPEEMALLKEGQVVVVTRPLSTTRNAGVAGDFAYDDEHVVRIDITRPKIGLARDISPVLKEIARAAGMPYTAMDEVVVRPTNRFRVSREGKQIVLTQV